MPLLTPDFSQDTSGPIPAGTYAARITSCETKHSGAQSKSPNTPYQLWTLELFGDPKVNGRRADVMTTDGKQAAWGIARLRQLYRAATGEDLADGKPFDTDMLIGKEVAVTLVPKTKPDGTVSNFPDVKAVAPLKN